jgi:hypothetical protein
LVAFARCKGLSGLDETTGAFGVFFKIHGLLPFEHVANKWNPLFENDMLQMSKRRRMSARPLKGNLVVINVGAAI